VARVRLDRADLNRTIRGASRRELEATARQVVNRAKVLAPVDTGRLRASIRIESRRSLSLRTIYTVGSDVSYAKMVHDGTRPHRIPRSGLADPVLRFRMGGRIVYARYVNHPGTRARPFLDKAVREIAGGKGYDIRGA
jgi:hypothetical protein